MMIPNKFNGYSAGRRTYHKGGDGGAGDARRQEEERQRRITQATNTINAIFDGKAIKAGANQATAYDPNKTYYDAVGNVVSLPKLASPDELSNVYVNSISNVNKGAEGENSNIGGAMAYMADNGKAQKEINDMISSGQLFEGVNETPAAAKSRDQLYAEQKQAVFDINKRDVDKQYQQAERANRFGLARSGLLGGSADIDSNAQLQEKTNEGLMKAVGLADQAAADLKTQDERTRQSLISMAQSGIDTGTAQQMALRNLDANAQAATGARQGATIGNLFDGLSQAYLARQYANGVKTGMNQGQQWYGVSSPQQTYSGQVS